MPKKMNSDGEANKQADQQKKDFLNHGLKRIDYLLKLLEDNLYEIAVIDITESKHEAAIRFIKVPPDQKTKLRVLLETQKKDFLSELGINLL